MIKLKSIGRILGFLLFFLAVFVLSLAIKFPTEAAVRWALVELQDSMKIKAEVRSIERHNLSGVRLEGVALSWDNKQALTFAEFDSLQLWLNPFPLLWGRASLHLDVAAYGGKLSGRFSAGSGSSDIDCELQDLDIARLDLPRYIPGGLADFSAAGKLSGTVALHLVRDARPANGDKSGGNLDLDLNGLSISGIKLTIPLVGPFEIDPIAFDPTKLVLELRHPNLTISQGTLLGEQVEVLLSGKMTLNSSDFMKSNYAYTAKFKLGPQFDQQYGMALKMAAGQFNIKQDSQDYYRLDLRGSPSNPRIQQLRSR
ncbi:MAG: type II secretion system protein GspN [Candidatus Alcyoniella australis]|nr:type II secretion system protein GspN [Candidatus Alcyoniella australis]